MKQVKVVAAIIIHEEKVLATQRGYGEFKGGWEFPGGKVEQGETMEQALIREIREELNVEIQPQYNLGCIEYDYPTFHLSMECIVSHLKDAHIQLLEHEDAKWLDAHTLDTVDWLPADILILDKIRELLI